MKKTILSILCLSSLLTASAAQSAAAQADAVVPVAQMQTLVFVDDDNKELQVSTEMCKKFTPLKNLLDDDLQADGAESIPVYNCTQQTFEDLVAYFNAADKNVFLGNFQDHTRLIAMILAADHLGFQTVVSQNPLVIHEYTYALMNYALARLNSEQLQDCLRAVSFDIIRETLKKIEKTGFWRFERPLLKGIVRAANYLNACGDQRYNYPLDRLVKHLLTNYVNVLVPLETFQECAVEIEISKIRDVIARSDGKDIYDIRLNRVNDLYSSKMKFLRDHCGLSQEISIEELCKSGELQRQLFVLNMGAGKVSLDLSGRRIAKLNGLAAVPGIATVQHLDLNFNEITAIEPFTFRVCPRLERLNLRFNNLRTIGNLFSEQSENRIDACSLIFAGLTALKYGQPLLPAFSPGYRDIPWIVGTCYLSINTMKKLSSKEKAAILAVGTFAGCTFLKPQSIPLTFNAGALIMSSMCLGRLINSSGILLANSFYKKFGISRIKSNLGVPAHCEVLF